ncbi:hypothetical protein NMY22_g1253 [Coprinellus aureogranulatus]|nr:hypothetical protein NMY22_g1253 [Coprinellus aureogranulatus]
MSSSRPHSETSLVEDSEPERIVIRDKMGPNPRTPVDLGVIEIADSDSEPGTPTTPLPLPSKDTVASLRSPIPPAHAGDIDSDIDTPMVPRTLQLLDFACPARSSEGPFGASTSRLPSKANTPIPDDALPEPPKKPARAKKATPELSSVYTAKDIDRILQCIACDAKWTTRKSSAQKSDHMRKCCKKAGYTQATIDSLLSKAIQDAPQPILGATEVELPTSTPTLLAMMHPPEKKKTNAGTDKEHSDRSTRKPQQEPAFPATQAFGQSRLGAARRAKSLFAAEGSEEDSPVPTQDFGKSKLGAVHRTTDRSLFTTGDSSRSGSAAEGTGPPLKKTARGTRFSPSSGSTDSEVEALVPAVVAASLHDRPRVGRPKSKSPKRPRQAKRTREKIVYDSEWEDRLRTKILENKELHLRILRLEPIYLTEFTTLLSAGGKPDAKLVKHWELNERLFYPDDQGINFYTLSKWGRKKNTE